MEAEMSTTTALVVLESKGPFTLTNVKLKTLRSDELKVRMVATGVCHTDFSGTDGTIPVPTPVIVGHEGAGVVEEVGSDVNHVQKGDHVLLTFPHCEKCSACRKGNLAYCANSYKLSFGGGRLDGTTPFALEDGRDAHSFFGQSSFAQVSIVHKTCAVKVDKTLPLDILCTLCCGIQTGVGTILNVLKPGAGDTVVVYGTGAVGLSGIMAAARFTPAAKIIAVDILDSRLEMARQLGATDVINSRENNTAELIRTLTNGDGADCAYDTTGKIVVIDTMIEASASNATVATVGAAPPGDSVHIEIASWINRGIKYTGSCQGSSVPQLFLPALVDLWRQGRLPIEKLITKYDYRDINLAKADVLSGKCIKPVLIWDSDLAKVA